MEQKKIVVKVDVDLEELVPEYLENREKDVKSISELLEKNDFENIRIIGHSMKGSGGGYGFEVISEIGAAIELASKENNIDEIERQKNRLISYLDRVEVVFK